MPKPALTAFIRVLVSERASRRKEAIQEITSKWSTRQIIGGPIVTIPYTETWKDEEGETKSVIKYIQVLPETLNIEGEIRPEVRYRGIYQAVVYNAQLDLSGDFSFKKLQTMNIDLDQLLWDDAFVSMNISDMRGINEYVELKWGEQAVLFEPGIKRGNDLFDSGISVRIPLGFGNVSDGINYALHINLKGSQALSFLPLGKTTIANLRSSWNNPSFDGAFLPEQHQIDNNGFSADWQVLDLNRNYPQIWVENVSKKTVLSSEFGVNLFSPVDIYTQTTRAVKYMIMFVGLTFLVFFLVEVFSNNKIHPIQYLLIGVSLCIFYLLLLALSEHVNFGLAYFLASLSVVILIGAYVRSALEKKVIPLITVGMLTILYGFLYILLQNQDYALLIGSVGLFLIIAAVMYTTRNVNWYQIDLNNTLD
ncbi:MAG TPA: cell envelope integrity protein CreD [Firmicutes bacterium]|nr:cell envelope integrity protein CreD [Bacillota bacterium]